MKNLDITFDYELHVDKLSILLRELPEGIENVSINFFQGGEHS